MGLFGHIANPPPTGYLPLPDRIPSYMPVLSEVPSPVELTAYHNWWENDNVVSHILIARLSPTTRSLLPYDDGDSGMPRSARAIYEVLCNVYHLRGYTSGSALYSELRALSCGAWVQDFVTKWRAGISQLRSARYPLVFREVIEYFLSKLPGSVPFQMLRHNTMRDIDRVRDDDVGEFLRITNEVLDIDLLYHYHGFSSRQSTQNSATRHSHQPPSQPIPPITTTSTPPVLPTNGSNSSSLVCSICRARGHTGATCFKPGGGLEGQWDKYMANRNKSQAHLAQLNEYLNTRDRIKAFLAQIEEVLDGNAADSPLETISDNIETLPPDLLVDTSPPLPTFSALSLSMSPVVDTSIFNVELCYLYPLSDLSVILSAFGPSVPSLQNMTSALLPAAFLSSTFPYNAVLDSGCTHYILQDRAYFWTYDTTKATPVKTANCGYLQMLDSFLWHCAFSCYIWRAICRPCFTGLSTRSRCPD